MLLGVRGSVGPMGRWAHGAHGPWPQPAAAAFGRGLGPRSSAAAFGCVLRLRPSAAAVSTDRVPVSEKSFPTSFRGNLGPSLSLADNIRISLGRLAIQAGR